MVRRSSSSVVLRNAGFVQPGGQCGRAGVEFGADVGALRALADHAGVGARAQQQLQRIDENGLARAGLAREHREAGMQVQIQRLHDHEIAQRDPLQGHVQEPPSFQRSFLRRVAK
jgi:hypothetical protein